MKAFRRHLPNRYHATKAIFSTMKKSMSAKRRESNPHSEAQLNCCSSFAKSNATSCYKGLTFKGSILKPISKAQVPFGMKHGMKASLPIPMLDQLRSFSLRFVSPLPMRSTTSRSLRFALRPRFSVVFCTQQREMVMGQKY